MFCGFGRRTLLSDGNVKRKGETNVAGLSPMMVQYMETKKQYQDCILFYRLGDFYEMFFDTVSAVV